MILLTIGDDSRNAFRVCLGRLSRRGRFHWWQPNVFFIRNGRRV